MDKDLFLRFVIEFFVIKLDRNEYIFFRKKSIEKIIILNILNFFHGTTAPIFSIHPILSPFFSFFFSFYCIK